MTRKLKTAFVLWSAGVVASACDARPHEPIAPSNSRLTPIGLGMRPQSFANSVWSAPVNVGAPVNSSANEMNATLSPDELSLYFTSNRAGGLGGNDIWVSERACADCPWGTPVNLGAPINGPGAEAGPRLSSDGHLLFFQSDRPGGQGLNDIYLSRRHNPKDNFGWSDPVGLGPDVNTALSEAGADYLQNAEDGAGNLYFVRNPTIGSNLGNLYYAPITRDGETRGAAVVVSELGEENGGPGHPSVRSDGKEIFFQSARTGGFGALDIWASTRDNVHEPWSPPANLGAPVNTAFADMQPTLSHDGRTLLFNSNRPGGFGGNDLWISTRRPSAK